MNAHAQASLGDEIAAAVEKSLAQTSATVVEFPRSAAVMAARADIELHADLHRQCVAQAEQDQADAKRNFRQTQADIRAERKALRAQFDADIAARKAQFAADGAAIDEREETAKAGMEETVDKARRFAAKGRAWLAAE